jgi:hypothetical protein
MKFSKRRNKMGYLDQTIAAKKVAEDLQQNFRFRGMFVGQSKTGKTTAAMTLAGKKLLIDTDNRWRSVAGWPDVEVLPILDLASSQSVKAGLSVSDLSQDTLVRAWSILYDVNNELWLKARKDQLPYDVIVPDGLSSMNRIAMAFILSLKKEDGKDMATGIAGAPAQHHYGPQMHILAQIIHSLSSLPCHFILTGHMELWEDKKAGTIKYYPRMYGKTRNEIGSWFDECYETTRKFSPKEGIPHHYLTTTGYGNKEFLGSSMNLEGKFWKSPFRVDLSKKPCGIQELIELRFNPNKKEDTKTDTKPNYLNQTKLNQNKPN